MAILLCNVIHERFVLRCNCTRASFQKDFGSKFCLLKKLPTLLDVEYRYFFKKPFTYYDINNVGLEKKSYNYKLTYHNLKLDLEFYDFKLFN